MVAATEVQRTAEMIEDARERIAPEFARESARSRVGDHR